MRHPNKAAKGEPFRMHIILPGELVADMDAIAVSMTEEHPGLIVTRSDIARMAIHEVVLRMRRARAR